MNRKFTSKISFAIAMIGTLAAFSSNQVSAECWGDPEQTCRQNPKCEWFLPGAGMGQCTGEPKACSSSRANHNEKTCQGIQGCTWTPWAAYCKPIH